MGVADKKGDRGKPQGWKQYCAAEGVCAAPEVKKLRSGSAIPTRESRLQAKRTHSPPPVHRAKGKGGPCMERDFRGSHKVHLHSDACGAREGMPGERV